MDSCQKETVEVQADQAQKQVEDWENVGILTQQDIQKIQNT